MVSARCHITPINWMQHGRSIDKDDTWIFSKDGSVPSLQTAPHEVSAGHFGQHLRQVRERHGYIGQVLGRGVVHDAEELRKAGSGVLSCVP